MEIPSRKGYQGNDCRPNYSPITPPQVPAFDRIRRFCSLERPETPRSDGNEGATTQMHSPHFNVPVRSHIPLLGNLSAYGVDASCRKRLWDLEIRRLQQLNSSAEEVLKPNIDPNGGLFGGKIENKTFRELKSLANTIRLALFACIVDDAQEADPDSKASSPFALNCFEVLNRFANIHDEPPVPGVNPGSEVGTWIQNVRLSTRDQTSKAEQLRVSHNFHYLVDQITATVAQIAIKVSESEYWLVVALACLAKLAAKMKVIHSNFQQFIGFSAVRASSWALAHQHREKRSFRYEQRRSALRDDSPIIERHVREHLTVSSWLSDCITTILQNLGDQKPWWREDSCVDSCTVVFDTGPSATSTILHQNNHGALSGSSDKISISFSSVALQTVWRLGNMVTFTTLNAYPQNHTNNPSELYIELYLDLEDGGGGGRRSMPSCPIRIYNIIDYIVLVIPLSLTDPKIGNGYRHTLQEISSLSAFGVPKTHQIQIHGFVALKLNKPVVSGYSSKLEQSPAIPESEGTAKSGTSGRLQNDVSSSLMDSILVKKWRCLLGRQIGTDSEATHYESSLTRLKFKLQSGNSTREEISRISGNWIIQEKAIVVPCLNYVMSVAFLTILLVTGGIVCAFVIGERIPGVDPSNLTNFSWLLGGLSILVAKSLRVSNWTWRDFLLGQVSCRTVQELSDVTGLDSQDILCFLLSSEIHGVLRTGGPFQKVFSGAPEMDGFSIDVKANLQTLLASGIVLVDVLTLEGPALLWLRMVPGYQGMSLVLPSGADYKGWAQVCKNPPRAQGDGDAIITYDNSFSWIKILGLYNLKDVEFR